MFLTKELLQQLTGYKLGCKQVEWLLKNHIKFTINRYGHPLVLEKHLEELLCETPKGKVVKRIEPDIDALKRVTGVN